MAKFPVRDVIVLLPGITGSVLKRNGDPVWDLSAGGVFNALRSLGGSLEKIALQGPDDPAVDDVGDGIEATGLMPDLHLIPGLVEIDGYGRIRRSIFRAFDVTEGDNYFEFPYDWRRPNQVSARRLEKESRTWLERRRRKPGCEDAKLILIAHSMGGLVSRWFLEKLGGWERTRSLITFGTPYRGSVNAIDSLVHGVKKRIAFWTAIDLTPALRSFDSVYQLLPIYPCVDIGGDSLQRVAETDKLPGVDQDRAKTALAFHHAIRDAVTDHQDDPEYTSAGYTIYPISGISQPTKQSVRVENGRVTALQSHNGRDYKGDGTVPRVSALPLEVTDGRTGMFTDESHGSIQNDAGVLMHLQGLLTGRQINFNDFERLDLLDPVHLGVEVDEIFATDEEVKVTALADAEDLEVRAIAVNVDTRETSPIASLKMVADGRYEGVLAPLAAGVYRLTVELLGTREAVTNIITVA